MSQPTPAERLVAELPPDGCRDATIRIEDLRRLKRAGEVAVIEVDELGRVHVVVSRRYVLTHEPG